MDVPAIGRAKGLFEIFVPGVFLLLNFMWMLYCIQYPYWTTSSFYGSVNKNQILMLVIIIVFGYLAGVILWLFRADTPDYFSARLRKLIRGEEDFYNGDFPYIESLGIVAEKYLPLEAKIFYLMCWKPRADNKKNKYFFNYCKALVNAIDEKSAVEINSSEALIRYLAAMFHALVISSIFLIIIIILSISQIGINSRIDIMYDSIIFFFIYLISIIVLLWHFRYMRFKEVQTVFTASLINKASIYQYLCDDF